MSEQLHQGPEKHIPLTNNEAHTRKLEKELTEAARGAKHEHHEALEDIKLKIEQEAVSGKEHPGFDIKGEQTAKPQILTRDIRTHALKETLGGIRRHLNPTERAFSKLIHQKTVDKVSEAMSKTVARPPALLFGGLAAFIGTLVLIYVTRHYGFEYRFSAYLWLFGIGYMFGLVLELILKLFKRQKS